MSYQARSVSEAAERLGHHDPTLKLIYLYGTQVDDAELAELADCLLAHPDVVTEVWLGDNQLTDETGVKLARYVAASATIQYLDLSNNQLGPATYLAMAAALRVNSSLRELFVNNNQAVDQSRIDTAFVETLRLNPDRPVKSQWQLYSPFQDDLPRLRDPAEQLGHPSLRLLLAARLTDDRPTATLRH